MFKPVDRDSEISRFVGEALADEQEDIREQVLHVLSQLNDQQWQLFADIADLLAEERIRRNNSPE